MVNEIERVNKYFPEDVASHEMSIFIDEGVHRSIRMKKPDSSTYAFWINTWPGYLNISGDMGCYTFHRTHDMFEFFGSDGNINPQYWAEKLESGSGSGYDIAYEFDPDKFFQRIKQDYAENTEYYTERNITEEMVNDLKSYDNKFECYQYAIDTLGLDGCDCPNGDDFTYHYLWCLHAICWTIGQYRKVKAMEKV